MKIDLKKKLYRSRKDETFAGVCGGIAEYLDIDSTIVRLLFVAFALAGGPGILVYIILAFVVPQEPEFVQANTEKAKHEDLD